jgi:hydrogenase expression/formation protein HypE
VCEILGYDPLYLACEGRAVAVLAPEDAPRALAIWRALPGGEAAAVIGCVGDGGARGTEARVIVKTEVGGERVLDELEDDPLPRIC